MTEAVKQICEYVFSKSDILRIYAEPFAYNMLLAECLKKQDFSMKAH